MKTASEFDMHSLLVIAADAEPSIAKAVDCAADVIVPDLEDAVAPASKLKARAARRSGWGLAACRIYGVDSENRPQRGQFLPDLQAHSPAMGQKDGEKWTAAVDSQPTFHKSDRLPGRCFVRRSA